MSDPLFSMNDTFMFVHVLALWGRIQCQWLAQRNDSLAVWLAKLAAATLGIEPTQTTTSIAVCRYYYYMWPWMI